MAFCLAISAMKRSRGVEGLGLIPSGIKSISCVISSWTCSSFSMDKNNRAGGGCLGYGGRFGVDFDLCRL